MLLRHKSKIKTRKRFRRLGVWVMGRKATSTPLNLRSKVQNQGKEDWVQEQYLVFLVKREESRNFVVFFRVWKREKNVQRGWAEGEFREEKKKKVCPLGFGGAQGYLQPQARILRQRPTSKGLKKCGFGYPWKDLNFRFRKGMDLKNPTVKSKVMVRDISAVLTPISIHEQSLE